MTEDNPWQDEHYSLDVDGDTLIAAVAQAARIPPRPGVTWKASQVAMFGTDDTGHTVAYIQYIQDIAWPVSERNILRLLIRMLRTRIGI